MTSEYHCCQNIYKIDPVDLKCYLSEFNNSLCYIKEWGNYYSYINKDEGSDISICEACYETDETAITISINESKKILKSQFIKCTNDERLDELSVKCTECDRKFHAACVKHIDSQDDPYVCTICQNSGNLPKIPLINSNIIPVTDMSERIEKMVSKIVNNHFGYKLKHNENFRINIRVVADGELSFTLDSPLVRHILKNQNDVLQYRAKTILGFQMIDNVETLFFALFVHEFGDETILQNQKKVYIAYLDSVNHFSPKEIRTKVYQEIIIGYLLDAKKRGFLTAQIWSCPPDQDKEYIFFRHPSSQKVPSHDRLLSWYKSTLDEAVNRKIIFKYQNFYSYIMENKLKYHDIPLFDGDYWPLALLDLMPPNRKTNHAFVQTAKHFQDTFLVIILQRPERVQNERVLHDSRCTFRCTDFIIRRDMFLYFCRDSLMEFSTLRRTQLTTIKVLTELKRENQTNNKFTCDNCDNQLKTQRYSCPSCVEYDLCQYCYQNNVHSHHQMQLFNDTRDIFMRDVLKWFSHTLKCKECERYECYVIKALINHASYCHGSLKHCKQCQYFIIIIQAHLHTCVDDRCILPECKTKKEQDKRHQAYLAMIRAYENKQRYERARENMVSSYEELRGFSVPSTMLSDEKRTYDYIIHQVKYRNLNQDDFNMWLQQEFNISKEFKNYLLQSVSPLFIENNNKCLIKTEEYHQLSPLSEIASKQIGKRVIQHNSDNEDVNIITEKKPCYMAPASSLLTKAVKKEKIENKSAATIMVSIQPTVINSGPMYNDIQKLETYNVQSYDSNNIQNLNQNPWSSQISHVYSNTSNISTLKYPNATYHSMVRNVNISNQQLNMPYQLLNQTSILQAPTNTPTFRSSIMRNRLSSIIKRPIQPNNIDNTNTNCLTFYR